MSKRAKYQRKVYRCECGKLAHYRLRVMALRPDLCSELRFTLYLCEACLRLEQEMRANYGIPPPKVVRLK